MDSAVFLIQYYLFRLPGIPLVTQLHLRAIFPVPQGSDFSGHSPAALSTNGCLLNCSNAYQFHTGTLARKTCTACHRECCTRDSAFLRICQNSELIGADTSFEKQPDGESYRKIKLTKGTKHNHFLCKGWLLHESY